MPSNDIEGALSTFLICSVIGTIACVLVVGDWQVVIPVAVALLFVFSWAGKIRK